MTQLIGRSAIAGLFIISIVGISSVLSTSPGLAIPAEQYQRDKIVPTVAEALGYGDPSVAVQPYVKRITLQGDYGLADWERGEAGGMVVVVSHRQNTWTVIRLGGGVPSAADLSQATGMSVADAQSLLKEHLGN